MNTSKSNIVELSFTEQAEISGGFFFLIPALVGLAGSATAAAAALYPIGSAAVNGWNNVE